MTTTEDHAKANALAWMDNIREMVKALEASRQRAKLDDWLDSDAERDTISQSVLSVEVRDDWRAASDDSGDPVEFRILLSTGGPACRIIGELEDSEPYSAKIQYQDWGTPWTDAPRQHGDTDILLTFCRCFYFGE